MANHEFRTTSAPADLEGDLASLRGDCARMAPRWPGPEPDAEAAAPVSPSRIHGVSVPPSSARLVERMSDYGTRMTDGGPRKAVGGTRTADCGD
ncbi:hypothetical protein GCM10010524_47530 [Streptomyces mexicanus]